MIPEITTVAMIACNPVPSRGSSDTARFIAEAVAGGRMKLQSSTFFGRDALETLADLNAIAEECRLPDWDGYGAIGVSRDTLQYAKAFFNALPLGTPSPSIGAEPDGHITMEWYKSPRRTLSLSISPIGELHYAALFGMRKAYGTELFFGDVPKVIRDLISEVVRNPMLGAA